MASRNRPAAASRWLQPPAARPSRSPAAFTGLRHRSGHPTADICCSGRSATATRRRRTTSTGTWRRFQAGRPSGQKRARRCFEKDSRRFRDCRRRMRGPRLEIAFCFMAASATPRTCGRWRSLLGVGGSAGQPQRATFGTTDEAAASVASDGRMVFISRTMGADIWSLPIDANRGKQEGDLKRVTQDAADDYDPSVSEDGTTLVFRSRRGGRFGIILRKLATNAETVLTRMPEDHYAALSRDGTKVAYSYRENGKMPIFIVAASGGAPEKVCDDCGEVEAWAPAGDQILYVTAGDPSGVGLLTIGASHNDAWLKNPGYGIYNPRPSSDGRWVAFNGRRDRLAPAQVFVARIEGSAVAGSKDWIAVSADGDAPAWSPDASVLYFWSDRDKSPCVWAQRSRPGDETAGRSATEHPALSSQGTVVEESLPRRARDCGCAGQDCLQPRRTYRQYLDDTAIAAAGVTSSVRVRQRAACVRASSGEQSGHAPTSQSCRRSPRSRTEPHLQHGRGRGAAPRPRGESRRRSRHRWILCARRGRGRERPAGPFARSADAVLPRQASRRPGALRRGSHRPAARRARCRRAGQPIPSQLHAHDPRALRGRDCARRLPRPGSGLHAILHADDRTRCRRRSTRSDDGTSAQWPTRSRSG